MILGIVAALCLGLNACSSSPSTDVQIDTTRSAPAQSAAVSDAAVDPCTLLTPAEAASLLGGPAQHEADPARVIAQGNGLDATGYPRTKT